MGLYDFFENEQIKCFYYEYIKEDGRIFTVNGNMTTFKVGDIIPWKTFYYNYSPDFLVVDATKKDGPIIYSIETGIFKGELKGTNIPNVVIDKFGNQINITTYEEIFQYYIDYQTSDKKYVENLTLFINETKSKSLKNPEKFKKGTLKCLSDAFKNFEKKWFKKKSSVYCGSNVGAILATYYFSKEPQEKEQLKVIFNELYEKDSKIINKYIYWFNKEVAVVYNHYLERGRPFYVDIEKLINELYS